MLDDASIKQVSCLALKVCFPSIQDAIQIIGNFKILHLQFQHHPQKKDATQVRDEETVVGRASSAEKIRGRPAVGDLALFPWWKGQNVGSHNNGTEIGRLI